MAIAANALENKVTNFPAPAKKPRATRKPAKTQETATATAKAKAERTGHLFKGGIYNVTLEFFRRERFAKFFIYAASIVLGSFFPACAFISKHYIGLVANGESGLSVLIGIGAFFLTVACLAFSLPTALSVGKVAFDGLKGQGFGYALELAMLLCPNWYVQIVALSILCIINTLATFYNLQSGNKVSTLIEKPATA